MKEVQHNRLTTQVRWLDGSTTSLPNLWLRDNCDCSDCRIDQTTEKKFLLSSVSADICPEEVAVTEDLLTLTWPDGHVTHYAAEKIRALSTDASTPITYWDSSFRPTRTDYRRFIEDDACAATAIRAFLESGALVITDMPSVSGTVESLQPRLGRIRDMPFGRLHEVIVDPTGYNVAHTALPLPPHTDFASANWPPSIQALHMLINECEGGESVIVDGWAVAEVLRREQPDMFKALCQTPVPFRMFSDDEETFAVNPLIKLDTEGAIRHFRYSNQLMQPMNPLSPGVAEFYQAYHELTRRLTSDASRAVFRLESGDCLLVAGHRVLHAREGFNPNGRRHLQDAYFEHDCCRNHLTVIERRSGV